jgi:transitional endoplasmic reticulum ATPase
MEPALLRAGRFDSIIEFPLPGKEERVEILELYMQSLPFRTEVDIELLAGMSEGWTGAELEALCKKAVVVVLEECLASGEKLDYMLLKITTKHFDRAIEKNGASSAIRPREMKH